MKPRDDDVEMFRDPLRDLARGVRIAHLPVMLGDRLVPPRQHEFVAEREMVVAPPERPTDPQAAIRQRDEDVLVRSPCEFDRQFSNSSSGRCSRTWNAQIASNVEALRQRRVELGDVGDVIDPRDASRSSVFTVTPACSR